MVEKHSDYIDPDEDDSFDEEKLKFRNIAMGIVERIGRFASKMAGDYVRMADAYIYSVQVLFDLLAPHLDEDTQEKIKKTEKDYDESIGDELPDMMALRNNMALHRNIFKLLSTWLAKEKYMTGGGSEDEDF